MDDNETQKILAEVAKRKQRAIELGLKDILRFMISPEILNPFEFDECFKACSFASDFKRTSKSQTPEERRTQPIYTFTLKGKKYSAYCLSLVHPATIEIFVDGKKVFSGDANSPLTPSDIESFVEGDWVEDLRQLMLQHAEARKQRQRRQEEDPKRINKLKEDFSL